MIKVIDKGSYTSKKDGNKRYVYTLNKDGFNFGQFIGRSDVADVGDQVVVEFGYYNNAYYIKSIERTSCDG